MANPVSSKNKDNSAAIATRAVLLKLTRFRCSSQTDFRDILNRVRKSFQLQLIRFVMAEICPGVFSVKKYRIDRIDSFKRGCYAQNSIRKCVTKGSCCGKGDIGRKEYPLCTL